MMRTGRTMGPGSCSKLFGDLAQHYRSLFAEMERVQRGGLEMLARGDQDRAAARLNAL